MDNNTKLMYNEALDAAYMDKIKALYASCFTAAILRFVAVEVERMTERDMGGSFTVSNLKVGENLRELADEAEAAQ